MREKVQSRQTTNARRLRPLCLGRARSPQIRGSRGCPSITEGDCDLRSQEWPLVLKWKLNNVCNRSSIKVQKVCIQSGSNKKCFSTWSKTMGNLEKLRYAEVAFLPRQRRRGDCFNIFSSSQVLACLSNLQQDGACFWNRTFTSLELSYKGQEKLHDVCESWLLVSDSLSFSFYIRAVVMVLPMLNIGFTQGKTFRPHYLSLKDWRV